MVQNPNENEVVARDDGDEPPWSATMTLGGITYAVSLFWQPLQDPDDPMPEIKETAEGILDGADIYCLRTGNSPQYGLGLTEEGHRSGHVAAAIALADAFSDQASSVSVFKVDEGWWFLAIRNDLILSEEDVLYINEEDAQRAFFSMMAVPDWGRKIAPTSWGIEGTTEMELENILRDSRHVKLQKLGSIKGTKFVIAIGIAGLIALWIIYKILAFIFGWSTEETKKPLFLPPPVTKTTIKTTAPVVIEEKKPWESLPVTEDVLNYCWESIVHLKGLIIPGWKMQEAACNAMGVSASWKREWGRIAWLNKALEEYNIQFASKVLSPSGDEFVGIMLLTSIRFAPSPPTMDSKDLQSELNDIFQAIGLTVAIAEEKKEEKIVTKGIEKKIEKKYSSIKFNFKSSYDPKMWIAMLTKFSSTEILSVRYFVDSGIWGYEGRIYDRQS